MGNPGLVAIKNKLYVIGGISCQVYNGSSKKFVLINKPPIGSSLFLGQSSKAVSIAGKIFVFKEDGSKVISYNINTNEWIEECMVTGLIKNGCCVKMPQNN